MARGTTFLDEILARKGRDLAIRMEAVPLVQVQAQAEAAPPPRGFAAWLRRARRLAPDGRLNPALIGEIKRASPSKGLIRQDFRPADLARQYRRGGASAISVLTDEPFFQGRPEYLTTARETSGLPVLRKDFLLEPYQIYEARALGADAVLLIAAALDRRQLRRLLTLTTSLGMDALVEVHDLWELDMALAAGASLIGINNRDLRSFRTDLRVTEELAPRVPPECLVVSESGISDRDGLLRVTAAGAGAALVGEGLMRQDDVAAATSRLLGLDPGDHQVNAPVILDALQHTGLPPTPFDPARPWVKICGHTQRESVQAAVQAGASAVGFVFAPSRRRVTPEQAAELGRWAPAWVERIGVLVPPQPVEGSWAGQVAAAVGEAHLTGVQLHGCRSPEAVRQVRRLLPPEVRLLVAVAVRERGDLAPLADMAGAGAGAILLDALVPGQAGGTGRRFDWSLVPLARERLGLRLPLYLAGGLTPENAVAAWQVSGADGLDVSSGVETEGRKDPVRIRAFLEVLGGGGR